MEVQANPPLMNYLFLYFCQNYCLSLLGSWKAALEQPNLSRILSIDLCGVLDPFITFICQIWKSYTTSKRNIILIHFDHRLIRVSHDQQFDSMFLSNPLCYYYCFIIQYHLISFCTIRLYLGRTEWNFGSPYGQVHAG